MIHTCGHTDVFTLTLRNVVTTVPNCCVFSFRNFNHAHKCTQCLLYDLQFREKYVFMTIAIDEFAYDTIVNIFMSKWVRICGKHCFSLALICAACVYDKNKRIFLAKYALSFHNLFI